MSNAVIAIVTSLIGSVQIIDENGQQRLLKVGDKIHENDTIIGDGNGLVVLQSIHGDSISLTPTEAVRITANLFDELSSHYTDAYQTQQQTELQAEFTLKQTINSTREGSSFVAQLIDSQTEAELSNTIYLEQAKVTTNEMVQQSNRDQTVNETDVYFPDSQAIGGRPATPQIDTVINQFDGENKLIGTHISGKADPNSRIEIHDHQGKLVGTTTTDANGNFTLTVMPALTDGEVYNVTAFDRNNIESKPAQVTGDTTAPSAPTINDVTHDKDGVPSSTVIEGEAETGAKVEVIDKNTGEVIGETIVGEDGDFKIVIEPALEDGSYDVIVTDPHGNKSEPTEIEFNTEAPEITDVTNNFDDEGNAESTTITGTTEPNKVVEIFDEAGNKVGETTAGNNGNFSVTVTPALEDGKDYEVIAKDEFGNTTAPAIVTGDTSAPEKPIIDEVTNNFDASGNAESTTITGEAEAGSKVEIIDPVTGEVVGETTADSNGKFEVTVEPALEDGKEYDVVAKDNHGNTSEPAQITGDTTPPSIENLEITQFDFKPFGDADQTQIHFTTDDPDAEFIFYVNGEKVDVTQNGYTLQVDPNGDVFLTVQPPLPAGAELTIEAIDSYGNKNTKEDVEIPSELTRVGDDGPVLSDAQLENITNDNDSPTEKPLTGTQLNFKTDDPAALYTITVTAKGAPPSTQTLNNIEFAPENIIDNGDGTFTLTYVFEPALNAGDKVVITGTNSDGKTGNSIDVTAGIFIDIMGVEQHDKDTTADAIADETIVRFWANNKDKGMFEVYGPNGETPEKIIVKNVNGSGPWEYEVVFGDTLNNKKTPLKAGDQITIIGTLGEDTVTQTTTVPDGITNFADATAPNAPEIDGFVNNYEDGELQSTTITGTAEANTEITVYKPILDESGDPILDDEGNPTFEVVGTTTTDANGNFEITVEPALENGTEYEITATDKAGNESAPATVTGHTDAPASITDDLIKIGDNGDEWITENEINDGKVDVIITLPKNEDDDQQLKAGDKLIVNGEEITLTQDDISEGKIELEFDAPAEGEKLEVEVRVVDQNGNPSETTANKEAIVDTEAPQKPIVIEQVYETDDEGELVLDDDGNPILEEITGKTEPGATITDKDGNPILDDSNNPIIADENGEFTIPADKIPEDGQVAAKDDAGNLSGATNVLELPVIQNALDKVDSIVVDEFGNKTVTEHSTPENYDKFQANGFTNDDKPLFEIPEGQQVNTAVLIVDGQLVDAEEIAIDGKTYLTPTAPLPEGNHRIQYTIDMDAATAKDAVLDDDNNEVTPAQPEVRPDATAKPPVISDSFNFTIDTTPPAAPEITDVKNNYEDGVLTGTTIKGNVKDGDDNPEIGATVVVKDADGNIVGTGTTNSHGNFTIVTDEPLADGAEYTLEAIDKAGNKSEASDTLTGDTTAPAQPTKVILGDDGNAYINAAEAENDEFKVTVTLPETGVEKGDILVINGEEITITQAHLDNREVVHNLPTAGYNEGDLIEVDVFIKDDFGNPSDTVAKEATLDTIAPEVVLTQISPSEIKVVADEAGTLTLTDNEGAVLTDKDGNQLIIEVTEEQVGQDIVIEFAEPFDNNTRIKAELVDAAGNTGKKHIDINTSLTVAVDNTEELILNITPVKREASAEETTVGQNVASAGVASAGLGGVADAGVLDFGNNAIELIIEEGTERTLTLYAGGGGVSIGDTYNLVIFQKDPFGNIKFYDVYEDWFIVPFLGMTQTEQINTISEPGTYYIMLQSKAGVKVIGGAELEVRGDEVTDKRSGEYESVSGQIRGNVITDFDAKGIDNIDDPHNTKVTKIIYTDSADSRHEVDVPTFGNKTIQLEYGKLTISADGSYTYRLDEGARPEFGYEEKVEYTITNSNTGDSSSADLTIKLLDKPSAQTPGETVFLNLAPEANEITVPNNMVLAERTTWGDVAGVGLGPVADVGAIVIDNGLEITVGENQVRDITFKGEAGAPIALGYSPVDLVIYKKETTASGGTFWQEYAYVENWFGMVGVVIGAGQSDPMSFRFDEGEYKAMLISHTGGINVVPTQHLLVQSDTLYEYNATNNQVSGALDMVDDGEIYSVNGVRLGVDENGQKITQATINGEYGELTINLDGSYTYVLYPGLKYKDIGAIETFSYTVYDGTRLHNSTLNIDINNVHAEDDIGSAQFGMDNQEDVAVWQTNGTKAGAGNTTYSSDVFEVGENEIYDLAFNYTLGSRVDGLFIRLYKVNPDGSESLVYEGDVGDTQIVANRTGSLDWTFGNQGSGANGSFGPGAYRLEAEIDPRVANTTTYNFNLSGQAITVDQFTEDDQYLAVQTGNLVANDTFKESSGKAVFAHIEVNGIPLDYVENGAFGNNTTGGEGDFRFIELEGEHGTLKVFQNGDYEYTPNGTTFGQDIFDYQLVSIAGSSSSAQLIFNAGANMVGSEYNDTIIGTTGDDHLDGGAGLDILVGGTGDDFLTGGAGADIFKWNEGDAGSTTKPAIDTIMDFNQGNTGNYDAAEGDKIDLSDLLKDYRSSEEIAHYIDLKEVNGHVEIHINSKGKLADDGADQVIKLENVSLANLAGGATTPSEIMTQLIASGTLMIE